MGYHLLERVVFSILAEDQRVILRGLLEGFVHQNVVHELFSTLQVLYLQSKHPLIDG